MSEYLRAGVVQQPMASALMIRRECWESVGPLDEGMPLYFNDVDWCYRLYRNTEWKIFFLPDATAVHHWGASTTRLGLRRKIAFYEGLVRFYIKHFPSLQRPLVKHNGNKQAILARIENLP